MSLRWRIALGMAAIAALVSTLGAVAAFLNTADRLEASIDESLLSAARDLREAPDRSPRGHEGSGPDSSSGSSSECPPAGLLQPANAAQIITSTNQVAPCLQEGVTLPVNLHALNAVRDRGKPRLDTLSVSGTGYRVVTFARSDGTVLQLGRSLDENNDVLGSLGIRLALFTASGIAAAAALGWLLATRLVRPIERLRTAAVEIARTRELAGDFPPAGGGEVGSLTTSFATMVDALADSRRQQQQLVADASHELRTPLTSLQTNAELLDRGDRLTAAQRHQVSEGIRFEVGELTDLVSELVDLARDPGADNEAVESVDLAQLAAAAAVSARRRTDRPVTVFLDPDHRAASLDGRPKGLARAVSNLVDNAIKHGAGPIELSVHDATVEVHDHGPGIPDADLSRVFDRFYRADIARTAPGSGLGLAIVAQVVEHHGGTVFARNHGEGGAIVGFTLPV